jgi:hypothetical protein
VVPPPIAAPCTATTIGFGRPIASFQLVQDLLAKMLANVTACQCMMVRLAQMDDDGKLGDHHAALAKAFVTAKSRETVAWGRELLGGKTSLAVAWLQRLQQSGNAVAWFTIDSDDDDPATFFFYVAHALQRACEGVGTAAIDLIQESFLINPRAIVSTLMNDLADIDDDVYLALEDYHWPELR